MSAQRFLAFASSDVPICGGLIGAIVDQDTGFLQTDEVAWILMNALNTKTCALATAKMSRDHTGALVLKAIYSPLMRGHAKTLTSVRLQEDLHAGARVSIASILGEDSSALTPLVPITMTLKE